MSSTWVLLTGLPITKGHEDLIRYAGHFQAHQDGLELEYNVIIAVKEDEPYIEHRYAALKQLGLDPKFNNDIKVHLHYNKFTEDPNAEGFWEYWKSVFYEYGFEEGDYIVGSEPYIFTLAAILHGRSVPYDTGRTMRPISGTMVRENPVGLFREISYSMRKQMQKKFVLFGAESTGKALDLSTPLPTPSGWTTMQEVKVGDELLGPDGLPTKVTFVSDTQKNRDCYEITFSNGDKIVADADHLWLTDDYNERMSKIKREKRTYSSRPGNSGKNQIRNEAKIRTTKEIFDTLDARGGFCKNHSIDISMPLDLPEIELPISPYVLGSWLGDGTTSSGSMTIGDMDAEHFKIEFSTEGNPIYKTNVKYRYRVEGLHANLRELGLLGNKNIPKQYLRASFEQRLALLQGLMDTDGTIDNRPGVGRCELSLSDSELAKDARELINSLGICTFMNVNKSYLNGEPKKNRHRITFKTKLPVFRMPRKLDRLPTGKGTKFKRVTISNVVKVESRPVKCVQVDNMSHMYLAGDTMIPTHNTTISRAAATAFGGVQTHEFARPYLEQFGPEHKLTADDMNTIWSGQKSLETSLSARDDTPFIWMDTDIVSTYGYYKLYPHLINERSEGLDFMREESELSSLGRKYFVLSSNIPFEPDILRYGGDVRESSDQFWIDILEDLNADYEYIETGDMKERLSIISEYANFNLLSNYIREFND